VHLLMLMLVLVPVPVLTLVMRLLRMEQEGVTSDRGTWVDQGGVPHAPGSPTTLDLAATAGALPD
jgi:hypothetical protein